MSTEELIEELRLEEARLREVLRGQTATIDAVRTELLTHKDYSTEMLAASNTSRIARIKSALAPFAIDTSTWTG